MSARYSPLPELRLQIGDSALRRLLLVTLLLCEVIALALVFGSGYRLLAAGLGSAALAILAGLRRNASRGTTLRWRAGQWSVGRAGLLVAVELLPRARALPWGVYLAWEESISGRRGSCWLFADSVPPSGLRRLRCRLALQG